jgi:hypothetical protein
MPRSRPPYPAEFRARIIELARAGRSPEDLAKAFEPCSHPIRSGLAGVSRRRGPRTTVRDARLRPASDLMDRNVFAEKPDVLWVADITPGRAGGRLYVPTWAGFLYPAVVLDAFSRRIVGWAMGTDLKTDLVLDALNMAVQQRRPGNVIHHLDQGSPFASAAFGLRCKEAGVRPSMGSVGDATACLRAGAAGPGGRRHVRERLRDARMRTASTPQVPDEGGGPAWASSSSSRDGTTRHAVTPTTDAAVPPHGGVARTADRARA